MKTNTLKRIGYHALAFIIVLPVIFLFAEGCILVNFIAILYLLVIYYLSACTPKGRKFTKRMYKILNGGRM